MEWVVLVAITLLAAAYIAVPARPGVESPEPPVDELRRDREAMLVELRELDDDAAEGRISAEDRLAGRRALGPRLREVTEALRERGETPSGWRGPSG
jgi:hypothetical protein